MENDGHKDFRPMPIHTTNQPRTNSDGVCTVNDAMQFSAAKICLMVIKICAA